MENTRRKRKSAYKLQPNMQYLIPAIPVAVERWSWLGHAGVSAG